MGKCLMLEREKKRFFTLLKYKKSLSEYCRTFGAKMTVVRAEIERGQVLELPKLITALCDKNYKNRPIKFEKIGNK